MRFTIFATQAAACYVFGLIGWLAQEPNPGAAYWFGIGAAVMAGAACRYIEWDFKNAAECKRLADQIQYGVDNDQT